MYIFVTVRSYLQATSVKKNKKENAVLSH